MQRARVGGSIPTAAAMSKYGSLVEEGCTPGFVELSRTPTGVFVLAMTADQDPENRFLPHLSQALLRAFDAVERRLAADVDGPAALVTVSESAKFFSNGIDPDGKYSKKLALPGISDFERLSGGFLTMASFIRPLQLPIPTVAAVGGHAIGAGLMFAAGHDYRLQAEGRGFMCAMEVAIGVGIPPPELELFRHVLPKPDFYDTVMGAKRWTAAESLRAGLVVKTPVPDRLFEEALAFAESKARLVAGERMRKNFMHIKDRIKGQVQRMVMDYTFPGHKFPPETAKAEGFEGYVRETFPYLMGHLGEVIEDVPVIPPRPKAKL